MDRLVSSPDRDYETKQGKKLAAISSDLFVSIPKRDYMQWVQSQLLPNISLS
jgi:hypothetical protein